MFHPEGRLPWRVTRYLSIREIEGEKGRVGEWERDTKRSHTQCVSPEGRGRQEGPRGRLKSALKSARMRLDSLMELKFFSVLSLSPLF